MNGPHGEAMNEPMINLYGTLCETQMNISKL